LIPWLARYVAAAALGEYLGQHAPSPACLGVHVGLGLMLLCGLLAVDMRPALRRWLAIPAALGRASLAVFIAKYFFCFTMLEWWKRRCSPFWPLLLMASLTVVVAFGLLWARFGNNNAFGVGHRWLATPPAGRPRRPARPLDRLPHRE
jgi:MFS superfamily sulfate permease-like transporter